VAAVLVSTSALARRAGALAIIAAVAYQTLAFPVARIALAVGLTAVWLAVHKRPAIWAGIIAAMLPAVDLTPWSGRFFLDELDLVIFTIAAAITWSGGGHRRAPRAFAIAVAGAVLAAWFIGAVRGLLSGAAGDFDWIASYRSPYNALRMAKPCFYAMYFWTVIWQSGASSREAWRDFLRGTAVGLAALAILIVAERLAFPGLADFTSDYRVTGPFSTMHTGGAAVDGYLLLAMPLAGSVLIRARRPAVQLIGVLLAIAVAYALIVTVSRATIALAAAQGVALLAAVAWQRKSLGVHFGYYAAAMALPCAAAAAICFAPFFKQRLAASEDDWTARVAHWRNVVAARGESAPVRLFGEGIGTFPKLFAARFPDSAAADYRIGRHQDQAYLQLEGGDAVYFGQYVPARTGESYRLEFDCRTAEAGPLAVGLCEKSLMHSFGCDIASIAPGGAADGWRHFEVPLSIASESLDERRGDRPLGRPVNLAFWETTQNGAHDIDNVRLVDAGGTNLVANGDFQHGHDRWFYSADNLLLWHANNLYLYLWFEQGWLGLAAFCAISLYAIAAVARQWAANDPEAPFIACAIGGFLALGMFDSLLDAPRIALLYLLILGFVLFGRGATKPAP
jgi:hypothetical protein